MSVQNSIMCGARGGEALPMLLRAIRVRPNEGGKFFGLPNTGGLWNFSRDNVDLP